ncbi:dUTP diphosphatase [Paracoccus sp. p3-h83]|uniref:dUTP diphosphatase n=1 Tax=Paracoccus sp. p3-h83 TaxID=3342805 RepID=UPI0035B83F60
MADPVIQVQRLPGADPAVPLPAYQTAGAAGADVCANFPGGQGVTLAPGERALIPTGLAMAIPDGFEVQIRARSGLALKHGLALVNGIGTIDADYRGPVSIIVVNLGLEAIEITHGMRIAQMVIAPVIRARFDLAPALPETARGTGGFGSTGME